MGQGRKIVNKCHQASGQRGLNPVVGTWGSNTEHAHRDVSLRHEKAGEGVSIPAGPKLFGTRDWFHRRQFFHGSQGVRVGEAEGWFQDDSHKGVQYRSLTCAVHSRACAPMRL